MTLRMVRGALIQETFVTPDQWQGEYFGKGKDSVARSLNKLDGDRVMHYSVSGTGLDMYSPGWYMDSLVHAMSTVFSAVGAYWQVWNMLRIVELIPVLKALCGEYSEARVKFPLQATIAMDEVYVACLLRVGFIERVTFSGGDMAHEKTAKTVGEQAIEALKSKQETCPLATELLLKARHSTNISVSPAYRRVLAKEVDVRLSQLLLHPEDLSDQLHQGWKTVCRLGRMTKRWHLCRIALLHDRSKDLVMKTWTLPGYWFYQLKYRLGATP